MPIKVLRLLWAMHREQVQPTPLHRLLDLNLKRLPPLRTLRILRQEDLQEIKVIASHIREDLLKEVIHS